MAFAWEGDLIRREMALIGFKEAGLPAKSAEVLVAAGVFSTQELIKEPWTDEEAKRRYASLQWRLSLAPGCTPRIVAQIQDLRARLLDERQAA